MKFIRSHLLAVLTILVFVVIPFLFWRGTWFGTVLTDSQMRQYLAEKDKSRRVQHALAQIEGMISTGDPKAKIWYPEVVKLATHPLKEVRITVAWVMGQDNSYSPFHGALSGLLHDREPMVRRNAALSLIRFQDPSGRGEILSILRSYPLTSNLHGTISLLVSTGHRCEHGTLLARIHSDRKTVDVLAPISGSVKNLFVQNGDSVEPGKQILTMVSGDNQVWEALRALYLVGTEQDLTVISLLTAGEYPEQIRQQAEQAIAGIRERSGR